MAAAVLHVSSPGSGTPRQSCEERQSCEGDESPASTGEQSPATTGEATTGEESPVTATPASHAQALPSDWRARIQASDASSFTGSEGERLPARAVPGDCLARIQASDASSFTGSEGERLPAQALPSDCLASIFSHLTDVRDVARAGATCRSWWRCYSDVVRKSVSCLSLAPNPLSLEWEPLYSRPLFPPPPLVNQPLFRDSLVRQPLLRQLCLQNVRPDSTNQLLNLTGLTAQGESAGLFMDDGQGSAGSSINGRDLRCCLEDLQRSPSLRPRVDEAMAAYIGASATLPLLSGESCLNSRTSRSLALSSLQDVLRLDTPPSTISWPLHRVASMLRSFPLLASLHLPFLSHIGAGSTQDGIEPECHYIDAVCRLVASCCPSLRHCHIQFGRRLQGGRTSQHPLLVTGTNSRSQPRTVTPFVNQEFADPNDIHSSLAEIITDSDNNPHSNPPSNPHLGLAWLFHKCPSLVSLHLISSSASPACLDLSPSLIPLFSRLTRLSLSLKTIPPSLLPSLTALNSLTLHVSDPACPVTCSSAPFTRLSLLSHLELRLGPNWATAYPVPRLFQDMFSGLQASLTSLSLTLPFVAHLPVSLWELTSLRSLCIINPAFHPGVQRPEYMSGVSGLRHLTCLQLLGHTVPGLVMGALGGDNQEERNVGDDQGEQVLGNPVPGLVLGALGGGVQEQGSVGEQRQQQQQQQQGRGQASGLQLTQLRMSRGTVAVLKAELVIRQPEAPQGTAALQGAEGDGAGEGAGEGAGDGVGAGAGEGAGEGVGEERLIEELEVDGDLLAAAAKRGAFLPHSLRVLSVTPSPAVAPSFLPQTVRLDVSSLASISLRVLKISGVYLSTRGNSALGSGCDACFFPNLLLLELRGVQTWHGKGLKKPLVKLARLARSASPFSNFRHQLLQHCPNLQILHMDSLPHSSPLPVLRSLGVLVIGSYADSGASLASLSQFVSLHTLRFNGIPSGVSGVLGGTISCPPNLQRLQICAQGITHLPRFTWKFTTITQLDLINFSKLKTSPEDVYSRFPSLQCLRVDGLRR